MDTYLLAAKQARRGVEQVRKRLLTPSPGTIEQCAVPLSEAIACMEEIQTYLRSPQSAAGGTVHLLRSEIRGLRGEMAVVAALLQSAGEFYQGFGRLLGTGSEEISSGYGSLGRTPPPEQARRLIMHG